MKKFLIFVALLVCAAVGWSEYVKRNPAERFYGVGESDTHPITMKDKWEIGWSCLGPTKITLESTGHGKPMVVANTEGPTMGSSYQAKGGEYTIHVVGVWPWAVSAANVGGGESPSPVAAPAPTPAPAAPAPAPSTAAAPSTNEVPPTTASAPPPSPTPTAPAAAPGTNTTVSTPPATTNTP